MAKLALDTKMVFSLPNSNIPDKIEHCNPDLGLPDNFPIELLFHTYPFFKDLVSLLESPHLSYGPEPV